MHKLYGIIPAGKRVQYKVMLVDRAHKTHDVTGKNEEESNQDIIQYISGYAPTL